MTAWLFDVFDRYVEDEVVDFEAELAIAQQTTQDYLGCLDTIPPFNPDEDTFQDFIQFF